MASSRGISAALLLLLGAAVVLRGAVTPLAAGLLQLGVGGLGLAVALRRDAAVACPSATVLALAWPLLVGLSALWSRSPDASLDAAAAAGAAAVVFLLASANLRGPTRRRFTIGFSLLGAGVAGVALVCAGTGDRASFPFGNPNHLAAWLLLPAGIGCVAVASEPLARRGRREEALLWFGMAAVTGAGIAASRSLGAALAAAAALGAFGLLRGLGPRRGVGLAAGAFVLGALLLAVLPGLWPTLIPSAVAGSESSPGLRWAVYAASARAAVEAAPLGVGAGAFATAFLAERPESVPYAARHAHSEPLHALVELGVPFVLLLLPSLVVAARFVGRRLAGRDCHATWGAAAAIFALAAHALVDFPLHVPAVALSGAALTGLLWSGGRDGVVPRIALATLSAGLLVLSLGQLGAGWAGRRAEQQLAEGRFAAALRNAELGLRLRPARASLHATLAQAADHAWRFEGGEEALRRRALEAASRAVATDPADPALRVLHAELRRRHGDAAGAFAELRAASLLDPRSPVPHLAMARLHLDRSEPEPAARALRDALERHPRALEPGLGALLAATGDASLVSRAIPESPRSRQVVASILSRHGYARAAAETYQQLFVRHPEDVRAALQAAEHFDRARDAASAEAVLRRALAHVPGDPELERKLAELRARGTRQGAG